MTEPKQPKRLNESFTPQKSQRPDDKERQNSATPNKNIRPNPTPQQPKEEPKTEPKSEPKTYTPSTGDILPIVTIGLISIVVIANTVQFVISKRKKD